MDTNKQKAHCRASAAQHCAPFSISVKNPSVFLSAPLAGVDVFHDVCSRIHAYGRMIQTKALAVHARFIVILRNIKGELVLAHMVIIGILCHFKGGTSERIFLHRRIDIQDDGVFFIQMQIQLGCFPGAILPGSFGILCKVLGNPDGFCQVMGFSLCWPFPYSPSRSWPTTTSGWNRRIWVTCQPFRSSFL